MKNTGLHKPVMADEVIGHLRLKNGYKVLDATVGCGGHANFILQKIQPDGLLIGVDRDGKSIEVAKKRLGGFNKICKFAQEDFRNIDKTLLKLGVSKIDAALFDFGISSYQLQDADRGFSFDGDGPLDMRMDTSGGVSAYELVNKYQRKDLENIIRDFGEERFYRRITDFILERRKACPIKSTRELAELIRRAVGKRYRSQKIHPATRTFQALRIAVNEELTSIDEALGKVMGFIVPKGRICAISFHSLEDRIVKFKFREFKKEGLGHIITKKPLTPLDEERRENPRSRSARLRVFEKL